MINSKYLERVPEKILVKENAENEKLRIGVAGIDSPGTSFVSGFIASLCAEKYDSSLIEPCGEYFFPALGMEKRFAMRGFTDCVQLLKKKQSIRAVDNTEEGINWLIRRPGSEELSYSELFRLINSAPGQIQIFDCSKISGPLLEDVLAEMDYTVLVADPLPTKLLKAPGSLERLRLLFPEAVLVINKMNSGVHKAELSRFLGAKDYITLPHIPPELIYRSEYNCALPYKDKEIKKLLAAGGRELMKNLDI